MGEKWMDSSPTMLTRKYSQPFSIFIFLQTYGTHIIIIITWNRIKTKMSLDNQYQSPVEKKGSLASACDNSFVLCLLWFFKENVICNQIHVLNSWLTINITSENVPNESITYFQNVNLLKGRRRVGGGGDFSYLLFGFLHNALGWCMPCI